MSRESRKWRSWSSSPSLWDAAHPLPFLGGWQQHLGVQGGHGLLRSLCLCFSPRENSESSRTLKQDGTTWCQITCGTLDQRDRKDKSTANHQVSLMLFCCPARLVVGQILCRQRLLLILRQTPFPAGCPAQSWLSLQHQGSTCRAEGDAGNGYFTGAASIRPGSWRSVSFEDRAITRTKSRKQRVDDVTILTSQKVMQGLPQLCQEAGMWHWGELEGLCRNSGKGKSGGSRGPAKSRAVYTHPLCCDEWRHEIQSVNPEISQD